MYSHTVAYRHSNGEVEGFIGYGFSSRSAKENVWARMANKCILIGNTFDAKRVIESPETLTPAEFDQVKRDWKVIE